MDLLSIDTEGKPVRRLLVATTTSEAIFGEKRLKQLCSVLMCESHDADVLQHQLITSHVITSMFAASLLAASLRATTVLHPISLHVMLQLRQMLLRGPCVQGQATRSSFYLRLRDLANVHSHCSGHFRHAC
eukprot:4865681-Amphidinium_carterae.2